MNMQESDMNSFRLSDRIFYALQLAIDQKDVLTAVCLGERLLNYP